MKIRPLGAECSMRTDGWTYGQTERRDEATVAFQDFANVPKNVYILSEGVVIHKSHYARNRFFSHKDFRERGFAHHAGITATNPSVGRGVT